MAANIPINHKVVLSFTIYRFVRILSFTKDNISRTTKKELDINIMKLTNVSNNLLGN